MNLSPLKQSLVFVFLSISILVSAQTFDIGVTNLNLIDSSRNNRTIAVEVSYPAVPGGGGMDVPVAGNNVPLVVVGHGFVMGIDAYTNVVNALTPNGYAVALVNTETGISPNHANFGNDLAFTVDAVIALGGIFTGKFGPKAAVMGHSMGGGASFLVAQSANVDCLVAFAPADTNPSAIAAATTITKPVLIFAGEDDCVASIADHQQPMYDSLTTNCKTLITVLGGSHCKFAENNFACSTGELFCSGSLSRADQHAVVNDFLLPYYDYFLKGDVSAWSAFNTLLTTDTRISYQHDCVFSCPDLTSVIAILPSTINDVSTVSYAVEVTELNQFDTDGSVIMVRIPQDPRLTFAWDPTLTTVAFVPVDNSNWIYTSTNPLFHTFQLNGVLPAGTSTAFGVISTYDPQGTSGQTTVTATVVPGSGGECTFTNNGDSEILVYFD